MFLRIEAAWEKANFFFGYADAISLKGIIFELGIER
ncbi:hypothetical protein NEOC65_000909 [Neochlamydia sp. AcF65]|nr:hypothetical protein [Neochlamydia sp. AcF65]MBS4169430.1 hypothetical protein [Neochlamydia sp. AcF95]